MGYLTSLSMQNDKLWVYLKTFPWRNRKEGDRWGDTWHPPLTSTSMSMGTYTCIDICIYITHKLTFKKSVANNYTRFQLKDPVVYQSMRDWGEVSIHTKEAQGFERGILWKLYKNVSLGIWEKRGGATALTQCRVWLVSALPLFHGLHGLCLLYLCSPWVLRVLALGSLV